MMFFKAAFALYLAALALAAPSPTPQGNLGGTIDGAGTFYLSLYLLCTSLSTADMSVKNVGKTVGDLAGKPGDGR